MGCEDYSLGTFLIARVHCGFQGSCSESFFFFFLGGVLVRTI
jgi:hypothetical protein